MVTWYDYDQQISGCTMHHPRPRDPLDHPRPVELLSVAQAPKEPEPPPAKEDLRNLVEDLRASVAPHDSAKLEDNGGQ